MFLYIYIVISSIFSTTKSSTLVDKCVLPPYPQHGNYTMEEDGIPGESYPMVTLNITCHPGYGIYHKDGIVTQTILCSSGNWSDEIPKCVRVCRLYTNPSVEYRCSAPEAVDGFKECGSTVPSGVHVTPVCRPGYYSPGVLISMECLDGMWDYIAKCNLECGTITPELAKKDRLPWYAGIYSKMDDYRQICGGSLVGPATVISAAHCFWSDENGKLEPHNFAAAVGKTYQDWDNIYDADEQKSEVAEILVPQTFKGATANFKDDVALVIVVTEFTYTPYIRPVCVNFDEIFDNNQLHDGNLGKLPGWDFIEKTYLASKVLKKVDLPYVRTDKCMAKTPPAFQKYITDDKICAGYPNDTSFATTKKHKSELSRKICVLPPFPQYGTYSMIGKENVTPGKIFDRVSLKITCDPGFVIENHRNVLTCLKGFGWMQPMPRCTRTRLCKEDSGGGLAFPSTEMGTERYYLRGVLSTAIWEGRCSSSTLATFTHLSALEHFSRQYF